MVGHAIRHMFRETLFAISKKARGYGMLAVIKLKRADGAFSISSGTFFQSESNWTLNAVDGAGFDTTVGESWNCDLNAWSPMRVGAAKCASHGKSRKLGIILYLIGPNTELWGTPLPAVDAYMVGASSEKGFVPVYNREGDSVTF